MVLSSYRPEAECGASGPWLPKEVVSGDTGPLGPELAERDSATCGAGGVPGGPGGCPPSRPDWGAGGDTPRCA